MSDSEVYMDDLEDDISLCCENPPSESLELKPVQTSTTLTLPHTDLASVNDGGKGKPCPRGQTSQDSSILQTPFLPAILSIQTDVLIVDFLC